MLNHLTIRNLSPVTRARSIPRRIHPPYQRSTLMTARLLKGLVVGLLLSFLMAASETLAQDASLIGGWPLTRIGVVVRDAQKAAKVYADVFQLASVPAVTTVKIDLPK